MPTDHKKHICVITTGRQDWSILRPVCLAIEKKPELYLSVIAGGMACEERYGNLSKDIATENIGQLYECPWLANGNINIFDECANISKLVSRQLQTIQPDVVILLGDRYETLQIATVCVLLNLPIVHLHGGEETEGAIDNVFRHAITKLSSLHFVSHTLHQQRVLQLGESPDTVYCVGAPGRDNLIRPDLLNRAALEAQVGHVLDTPLILVTLHPSTTEITSDDKPSTDCSAMIAAMRQFPATYLITLPNSDPGNQAIREALLQFAEQTPSAVAVNALGAKGYASALKLADAMLGNSSSALIEAPFFALPAVNIGNRQKGRLRLNNIKDVEADSQKIIEALQWATAPNTRTNLEESRYCLGDGNASSKIADILNQWVIPENLCKSFHTVI